MQICVFYCYLDEKTRAAALPLLQKLRVAKSYETSTLTTNIRCTVRFIFARCLHRRIPLMSAETWFFVEDISSSLPLRYHYSDLSPGLRSSQREPVIVTYAYLKCFSYCTFTVCYAWQLRIRIHILEKASWVCNMKVCRFSVGWIEYRIHHSYSGSSNCKPV